ncbi:hypothetical protein [Glutamicibacter sp. TV12E]|uniref:hypothetical protein n=1 Tax=Glutamicibacter sp. TV12E TaxID=3446362 RepID=UPI00403329F2
MGAWEKDALEVLMMTAPANDSSDKAQDLIAGFTMIPTIHYCACSKMVPLYNSRQLAVAGDG